jgi:flagellar L-ring protein precursor FlgH
MSCCDRGARAALAALFLLAATGCVEHALFESMVPADYRAVEPPAPPGASEGGIWPGDTQAGSFLFFDQKAHHVGDLLTVLVNENLAAEGSADTELDRESDLSAGLSSDVGFHEFVAQNFDRLFRYLGTDDPGHDVPTGSDLNVLTASSGNEFEGEGKTSREGSFTGVVTCRILQVLPGGVYHIRGRRMLHVNHEMQVVTVEGLVRREDIAVNNTVPSTALAEARLTFDGIGVIDDRQRPGLISRFMSWIYPL